MRNSSIGVTKEQYLEICKVTNSKVDPEAIPVDFSDFLVDTQIAMEIVHTLPDRWDGTSGTYQGKDLTILPFLLELYEVSEKLTMTQLIITIITESSEITNEKIQQRAKRGK